MSSLQKKNIVAFLNNELRVTTMAVGDGYNDAAMLREAKIGVCIKSTNGSYS